MDIQQTIDTALDNLVMSLGARNQQLEKELAIARTNLVIKDAQLKALEEKEEDNAEA